MNNWAQIFTSSCEINSERTSSGIKKHIKEVKIADLITGIVAEEGKHFIVGLMTNLHIQVISEGAKKNVVLQLNNINTFMGVWYGQKIHHGVTDWHRKACQVMLNSDPK